jgi:hypothetical protein
MKKLIVILLLLVTLEGIAQKSNWSDRVFFGGGFGFNGGTDFISVSLFPQLGYRITDRLSAGVGGMYQYVNFRAANVELQNYGGSVFSRYIVFQNIFVTTEYEYLTFEVPLNGSFNETDRLGFNSWFAGAGLAQPISRNASFVIVGLYNLLYDPAESSPYDSPFVFRVGVNVGF